MADRLILVTGGTGSLGRPLVRSLLEGGARVRVLTRRVPANPQEGTEYAVADYIAGTGLARALAGVSGVVHAAHDLSDPLRDVRGTLNLLEAARDAGCPHLTYVSIVGARRVRGFGYYAGKVRGEELVGASGLPHLIFRATQFHHFADGLFTQASRLPWLPVPDGTLQPVDVEDVARELARCTLGGKQGSFDLAGPEVLPIPEMARAWLAARGQERRVLPLRLPLPHPVLRAMQRGDLAQPDAPRGTVTWAEYLREKAARG